MPGIEPHKYLVAHIGIAKRVPGVKNIIRAERNINAFGSKFFYARHAAAFGISIGTAAQMHVNARVCHKVDAGHF